MRVRGLEEQVDDRAPAQGRHLLDVAPHHLGEPVGRAQDARDLRPVEVRHGQQRSSLHAASSSCSSRISSAPSISVEVHAHPLAPRGRQVLAHVVGPDGQLAVAAVDQDGELHQRRAPVVEERVDRGPDRAPRVEDVVHQDHGALGDVEVEHRLAHHRHGAAAPAADARRRRGRGRCPRCRGRARCPRTRRSGAARRRGQRHARACGSRPGRAGRGRRGAPRSRGRCGPPCAGAGPHRPAPSGRDGRYARHRAGRAGRRAVVIVRSFPASRDRVKGQSRNRSRRLRRHVVGPPRRGAALARGEWTSARRARGTGSRSGRSRAAPARAVETRARPRRGPRAGAKRLDRCVSASRPTSASRRQGRRLAGRACAASRAARSRSSSRKVASCTSRPAPRGGLERWPSQGSVSPEMTTRRPGRGAPSTCSGRTVAPVRRGRPRRPRCSTPEAGPSGTPSARAASTSNAPGRGRPRRRA